jgi:hypothetical protein
MLTSKCCDDNIYVVSGDEGTSYYACQRCNLACDPRTPFEFGEPFRVPCET